MHNLGFNKELTIYYFSEHSPDFVHVKLADVGTQVFFKLIIRAKFGHNPVCFHLGQAGTLFELIAYLVYEIGLPCPSE